LVIKNNSISRFSNYPTREDGDFSGYVTVKVCSSLNDHVQRLKVEVPMNINRVSAVSTKWALKKQVEASFLRAIGAKNTGVVIKIHILSP